MPKAVVKGVLARPGEYNYEGTIEIQTAEELKAAVDIQPSIMLTLGHPGDNPKVSDYIGRVDQTWNEEEQHVDAIFSFYDDHWLSIPERLRSKIVGGGKIPISAGISVVEVADGVQKGIRYDHVALLRDGENPVCPLGECGINVKGINTMLERRYQQETTIGEESKEAQPESAQPEVSSEVDGLKAEILALKAQFDELKETTSKREPEEVVEATPEEPETVEQADEPKPVPEMVIPAGVTKPPHTWTVTDQGNIEITHMPKKRIGGNK